MNIFDKLSGKQADALEPTPAPATPTSTPTPMQTPPSQRLSALASLNVESVDTAPTALAPSNTAVSREQIANFSTESLQPIDAMPSKDQVTVKQLDAEAMLKGPEGVKELLDEVDRLVMLDEKAVSPMYLPFLRDYIRQLMITLKEHSEFESIFVDRDIHNIVRVIRMLREEATVVLAARKEKKVTRETKAATAASTKSGKIKAAVDSLDLSDFKNAFGL